MYTMEGAEVFVAQRVVEAARIAAPLIRLSDPVNPKGFYKVVGDSGIWEKGVWGWIVIGIGFVSELLLGEERVFIWTFV